MILDEIVDKYLLVIFSSKVKAAVHHEFVEECNIKLLDNPFTIKEMSLNDVLSNVFLLYAYNLFNRSLLCENTRPYGGFSKQLKSVTMVAYWKYYTF